MDGAQEPGRLRLPDSLLARRDAAPTTTAVVGAAGSFTTTSTLLGSPLLAAFLLMEASGLGDVMLGSPYVVPARLMPVAATVSSRGLARQADHLIHQLAAFARMHPGSGRRPRR